ncbi:hypothetical protein SAMN04487820_101339 [Actinopolyspora mzabensis]|uniref:Uncharacterized protein n=1 Tax=Actinopolyspora mzabensis TaxID=995066 RepID=A0A1G8VWN7_ACTMZ|nr:hypothetical protein [Actinopolyspora mzabensis]SDJ69660.1 hypothetical protein SAMN04487820_101339 [Actinopolyspora mzabensis]
MGLDNGIFQQLSKREHFWRGVGMMSAPLASLVVNVLQPPLWVGLLTVVAAGSAGFLVLRRFTTMETSPTGPLKPEKWRFGFPDRSTLRPNKHRSAETAEGTD